MRAAVAKANSNRLTDIQHRVLLAALAGTAAWTKFEDRTCVAEIAKLAGLEPDATGDHRSVRRALARLTELGILEWEPAQGRGKKSTLRLPSATEENRTHRDVQFSGNENRTNGTAKTGHPGCPATEEIRTEELLAKTSMVKEKAGRQVLSAASPARSRAKARCGADAPLPAASESELEDEQERSSWVGGETPTVPAYPASALSADRQSEAVAVADHELGDDDCQVGGGAGNSDGDVREPTVGTGHGDVPNCDSGRPAPVPPELQAALPARLNADVVRHAAEHYAETPLAVLNHAERAAALGREPERLFAASFGRAVENDELGELQARLEHEGEAGADPEPHERPKTITGCREIRGSHSSRCEFDPLGTDQPPHDWPHPRPTYEQILEARNASQPHADPEPRYEPQLLANARAFYTAFRNDYPPDAMRDELELRYPSLGSGDLELVVGTPIDTPPPPLKPADPETTTLTPELRAQLPWKLKVDQPPATHEGLLHEQDELDQP